MKRTLLFVWGLSSILFAQDPPAVEYVEFTQRVDAQGNVVCSQRTLSQADMDRLLAASETSGLHIISETIGRRDKKGTLLKGSAATGLDIILRGTAQLDGLPAAKQAFINAAATWEARLKNPVTIVMDVDYGTTRFGTAYGTGVLGSTSSAVFTLSSVSMKQFAESLRVRNPQFGDLYRNIPDTLPNTTAVVKPVPSGTLANLQALGFRAQKESLAFGSAPSIGFNSAYPYDFTPADGITSGQTDFDAVAVHEMGHALGFVSVVGSTGSARTWDLFRFRPGTVKDTNSFRTAKRVLTPGPNPSGGDHVFWDGNVEWETSTDNGSRNGGGDQQQASHWRDDGLRSTIPLSERKIGIMDPNLASGVRDTITLADLKALAVMGWKIDLPAEIYEPLNFTAFSNFTTPNVVKFSWKNPVNSYDGAPLAAYKVVVLRDEKPYKEFPSPLPGETIAFDDTAVTQYTAYAYRFMNVRGAGDSSRPRRATIFAGGSAVPSKGTLVSFSNNGTTVALRLRTPATHNDNTPLHNLQRAVVLRTASGTQSLFDSVAVTDTSTMIYFVDIPLAKVSAYDVGFLGAAPFRAIGPTVGTSSIATGKVATAAYSETFETSRTSVVSAYGWDSTKAAAHGGTYALGALDYPASANLTAYLPAVKGNGNPQLSFWTICRTEAGKDFGKVEVSKNRGKSWTEVLSLDESAHSEWAAGTNTWFKYDVNLTAFATDTIIVRFRLTSDAATSKFGWLLDDITLNPLATGVDELPSGLPTEFSLSQNFPNPFNPSTRINYAVKERVPVSLVVYDLLGKTVATLTNEVQDAGYYSRTVDGSRLSSGVYFYRFTAGTFVETKKLLLMK